MEKTSGGWKRVMACSVGVVCGLLILVGAWWGSHARAFRVLMERLPTAEDCEMQFYVSDEDGHRERRTIDDPQDRAAVLAEVERLDFSWPRLSDDLWDAAEYYSCFWIEIYRTSYLLELQIPLDDPQQGLIRADGKAFHVEGGEAFLAALEGWLYE
nr:hypothetical protein [uncultured Flavonifractor sp.]